MRFVRRVGANDGIDYDLYLPDTTWEDLLFGHGLSAGIAAVSEGQLKLALDAEGARGAYRLRVQTTEEGPLVHLSVGGTNVTLRRT